MSEKKNLLKDISDQIDTIIAHATNKYPERLWMFEVQKSVWQDAYYARERGQKLIMLGPNGPTELVYAMGAVPFVLDLVPTRLASSTDSAKYIDIAEKYVPQNMCGISKLDLGVILSGDIVDKPDALIYTTTPCDSSRVAYPAIGEILGVPTYCVDTPYRKDERGFRYIAEQLRDVVALLEEVTGNKLDLDRLAEVVTRSNTAARLLSDIADLRKNIPCPLPGRLLVLNELFGSMLGSQAMIDFLRAEYAVGKAALDKKQGVTRGEEQFRLIWLQNMLWSNVGIMDWLEKEYNSVVIMDGFGYKGTNIIEDVRDEEQVFLGLAQRCMNIPMIHGASGPAQPWIELVDNTIREFKINASMFVGHVGCKHTWAAGKLIKDYVQDTFGIPTLTFDIDAIDMRYKSTDEIKVIISEYMDTLMERKAAV
jgi:benzoyl-CoA reductase/2-hydroxyglutaryl-CoA dehydratase subunit BcrC/BadD/HgdB